MVALDQECGDMPAVTLSRKALMAAMQDGTIKDVWGVCEYPHEISLSDYRRRYERGGIAKRIVDAYPNATWRERPDILPQAIADQFDTLDEEFHILATLKRADRLMGLGRYAVILMGVSGGERLDVPLKGERELLFLQPHGEETVEIIEYETDANSPRFGLPRLYQIQVGDPENPVPKRVHHSRVIHLAEDGLEHTILGSPALEPIWNRLLDLDKLLGGGAEVYWQNAAKVTVFSADKEVEWDPEEQEELKKELEEMDQGLRRSLRIRGVEPHILAAPVADPSQLISAVLDEIGGAKGIPKRILMGTERGELASSQDEVNFSSRVVERRQGWALPYAFLPMLSFLFGVGALSSWEKADWPQGDSLSPEKQAEIAARLTTALKNYTSTPGAEYLVSPEEFRSMIGLEGPAPEISEPDEEGEKG